MVLFDYDWTSLKSNFPLFIDRFYLPLFFHLILIDFLARTSFFSLLYKPAIDILLPSLIRKIYI
jgi:hypothetical protein